MFRRSSHKKERPFRKRRRLKKEEGEEKEPSFRWKEGGNSSNAFEEAASSYMRKGQSPSAYSVNGKRRDTRTHETGSPVPCTRKKEERGSQSANSGEFRKEENQQSASRRKIESTSRRKREKLVCNFHENPRKGR